MIQAESFVSAAQEKGFELWTGVPCSYLKPFINYVIDSKELRYIGATNEGDAVAIAAGAELGGKRAVVMFQNSGFGNAVNPLTSLNAIFKIPSLVITTWRGEPGGAADEPQHELMGEVTPGLFELMKIPYEIFPTEEKDVRPVLERAVKHMDQTGLPYGLIMKKGAVDKHPLRSQPEVKGLSHREIIPATKRTWGSDLPTRKQVLELVQGQLREEDVVIATTGFTGRSLYALEDKPCQLYMVGSMGCASTLGLGLAAAQPDRRVIVLDGDGAALMRLGALATVGYERPKNLIHILLDNEVHDSTGGQSTVSHSVDLGAIARACGYPRVVQTTQPRLISSELQSAGTELTFIHVKTGKDDNASLPRPTITPREVAERLRGFIQGRLPAGK